jgi:hypothetical protein
MPPEDANTQNGNKSDATTEGGGAPNATFETWLDKQDASVKDMYSKHTAGLTSALQKEREERKGLSDKIKELLPQAEKGSEFEKKLTETVGQLDLAEKRAAFSEEAIKPEIGCINPRAAFLLAKADDLFDRSGHPNWTAIKKAAPELFMTEGSTDGGAGGDQHKSASSNSMNDFIRRRNRR